MTPIDLNLLAVFDALYDLRSSTRAAQRLNITQSAVSHALRRLRASVGDPLFVRSGNGLQPTARAREMASDVKEGMASLRAAMMPTGFDPATAVRTFTMAAGPYFCALLVPKLVARVRAIAPGVTFRIVPVGPDLLSELDEGAVELAFGAFDRVPARLTVQTLFREDLVWIASGLNPIGDGRLPADELARKPHLVVAARRAFETIPSFLAEGPLESRLRDRSGGRTAPDASSPMPVIVYDALTAAAIVAKTDMVALVPRRLARSEETRLGLRILETDEESRGIDLGIVTHSRSAAAVRAS
jgi:DNA-binding transcriptional LysR family regulator